MFGYSKTDPPKLPRRVLHLASGDLWAGAEVQLYYLARYLQSSADIELLVVLLNPGELQQRLLAEGVRVKIIDESRYGFLRLLVMLMGLCREFHPDVIHTHRQKENLLGSLVSMILPGSDSLRTVHGADEHLPGRREFVKRLRRALDRWVGRWIQSRIVCVSSELKQGLSAAFPPRKLVVIPNGLDISAVQTQAVGADLGLPKDRIKVAFVGRMVPVKRIDLFVEIAHLADKQFPGRYQFYAIGDGPMLALARQQAAGYGLGNLTFTGFRKDSLRWLAGMDRLCIVSDHEGLPMVLLEAMALHIPIVARRVGGIGHVLGNGAAGSLVDDAGPAAFVDALERLRVSNDDSKVLVDEAWRRLNESFSVSVMAEKYKMLYHRNESDAVG